MNLPIKNKAIENSLKNGFSRQLINKSFPGKLNGCCLLYIDIVVLLYG